MNSIQLLGQIDLEKHRIVLTGNSYAELLLPPSFEDLKDVSHMAWVLLSGDIWSHLTREVAVLIRPALIDLFPGDKNKWASGKVTLSYPTWTHPESFNKGSWLHGKTDSKDDLTVAMPLSLSRWARKVGGIAMPGGSVDCAVEIYGPSHLRCVEILEERPPKDARAYPAIEKSPELNSRCQSENKRRTMSPKLRRQIFMRDRYRCQECGVTPASGSQVFLHVDHIIPVAHGGTNDESNLRTLCEQCNLGKGVQPAVVHQHAHG